MTSQSWTPVMDNSTDNLGSESFDAFEASDFGMEEASMLDIPLSASMPHTSHIPSSASFERPRMVQAQPSGTQRNFGAPMSKPLQMSPPSQQLRRNYSSPAPIARPHRLSSLQSSDTSESHKRHARSTSDMLYSGKFESLNQGMARLESEMDTIRSLNLQDISQRYDDLAANTEKELKKLYNMVNNLECFMEQLRSYFLISPGEPPSL